MFQIGRPCNNNFAHKESEYRSCPSRGRLAAMHQPDPHGAKAMGPLATWRWLLWTQPAGTNGRTRAFAGQKMKKKKLGNEMEGE